MQLWHDLSLGDGFPRVVPAVIEVVKGSRIKVVLDHEHGALRLKDFLFSPLAFPFHYGFFPQTLGTDKDPLDLILLADPWIPPLTVVTARLVAAVDVSYPEKGLERKIIAVCPGDPHHEKTEDLPDLPPAVLEKIQFFYDNFATADKRDLRFERFVGKFAAQQTLTDAAERYRLRLQAA